MTHITIEKAKLDQVLNLLWEINKHNAFFHGVNHKTVSTSREVIAFFEESFASPAAQPAQPVQETPFQIGQRLRQEGRGISDLWGAVSSDVDMPEAQRGFDSAAQPVQPVQEPVAIRQAFVDGAWHDLDKSSKWHGVPTRTIYTTSPAAQPMQPEERNFCPRCGKRIFDMTDIHTCIPPAPLKQLLSADELDALFGFKS